MGERNKEVGEVLDLYNKEIRQDSKMESPWKNNLV